MVDYETFNAMEALVDQVGESVQHTIEEYHDNALKAYEYLAAPGGYIELLGVTAPEVYHDDLEEIAEWNDDNLGGSYGIDASVTHEETFTNGIRLVFANAKIGIIGANDHSLADESHVVAGVYDEHGETGLESDRVMETDTITSDLEVYTADDPYETRQIIKDITRTYAEGRHLRRVVGADEGFVFVDGPLYPPQTLSEVMVHHRQGKPTAWTDLLGKNVGNYLQAVDSTLDDGWPIVGVVKSMDTSSLVNDLTEKVKVHGRSSINLVWDTDNAYLLDLLQPEDSGDLVHTSWFEETGRYCRIADEDGNKRVEPFEGSPYCSQNLDTYHRAFFYVRLTGTGTIMRIETAKGYVEDRRSRELIKNRVLAEIARSGSSPECILRADKHARLTRQNQDTLFSSLRRRMQKDLNYHADVRGPNYLDSQS